MTCLECDEKIDGTGIKFEGDFVCSMQCMKELERKRLEAFKSEEGLWRWLQPSETRSSTQNIKNSIAPAL